MIFETQNTFVETGSANSVYLLSTKAGVPLARTQAELTPLQRHVLQLSMVKEQEEYHKATGGSGTGSGPVRNSLSQRGGGGGETTTFVNVGSDEQE